MATRYFALIVGIFFLVVGILGFIPAFVALPVGAPHIALHQGYGYLMGLFPVNFVHNLVHIAIGVWGIASYSRYDRARVYARSIAVVYGVLAVLGLFPGADTLFGLVPLYGHDIWLHAITAIVAAYFGFVREHVEFSDRTPRTTPDRTIYNS